MNILYFVRHGETSWNKSKIYQGSTDIPLNSTGLQQAKLVSSYFKDISIDDIFTSPLKRASVTAEIIAKPHCISVKENRNLMEMNFGQWEGKCLSEINNDWPGMIEEMYINPDKVKIPDSESFQDVQKRTMRFINDLLDKSLQKTYVIVSHGAAIRTMLCGLLDIPLEKGWWLGQSNANVTCIYQLSSGRNILHKLNSTIHLMK